MTAGKSMVAMAWAVIASAAVSRSTVIGPSPRSAIEVDSRGCGRRRGHGVRGIPPRPSGRSGQCTVLTVGSSTNGQPSALTTVVDGLAVAADDRFLGRVSDQDVNPGLAANRCSHGFGRARDDSGDPVDRFGIRQIPQSLRAASHGPASSVWNSGDDLQPAQQLVAIGPRSQGDQSRGFAQAVADRRVGNDAEAAQHVGHEGAHRHTAQDRVAMVGERPGKSARHHQMPGSSCSCR